MNKVKRRRIFNVIIIIVVIGMIATIFAGISFGNKKGANQDDSVVIAEVYKAQVGCAMKVNLTDKGMKDYKGVSKCMVFVEGKQMSAPMNFNERFTVFPARKPKDKVDIKLLSKENKELGNVEVKLVEGK